VRHQLVSFCILLRKLKKSPFSKSTWTLHTFSNSYNKKWHKFGKQKRRTQMAFDARHEQWWAATPSPFPLGVGWGGDRFRVGVAL
jgi:hypothetical protein